MRPTTPANPPKPPPPGYVRIIGRVGADDRVTLTDPTWRPDPRPAPPLEDADVTD